MRKQFTLTPRQREILLRMVQGKQTPQIASELGLARSTVENHVARLYARIGVDNATSAAIYCMEKVWTDSEREAWIGNPGMQRFTDLAPKLGPLRMRIFDCLVEEPALKYEEIGRRLFVSPRTIDDYVNRVVGYCFPKYAHTWLRSRRVVLATHWWAVWTW